jgi:hypothetical protein
MEVSTTKRSLPSNMEVFYHVMMFAIGFALGCALECQRQIKRDEKKYPTSNLFEWSDGSFHDKKEPHL